MSADEDVPGTRAVMRFFVDVAMLPALFVVSVLVAGAVSIQSPGCITCGSLVGLTVGWIAFAAFQPVLWMWSGARWRRIGLWLLASFGGVAAYLTLESIAGSLFLRGNGGAGLTLGLLANEIGMVVGCVSAWWLMRRHRPL